MEQTDTKERKRAPGTLSCIRFASLGCLRVAIGPDGIDRSAVGDHLEVQMDPRGAPGCARLADYLELIRPRISVLVLFTMAAGACLATRGAPDAATLTCVLLGTGLVAAGASALYEQCPLERAHRDLHAAMQHVILQDVWLEDAGRVALGTPPLAPMFASRTSK